MSKEKCPVCKKEEVEVTETNIPSKFWNKKNLKIEKICDGHFFYSYEERIHEHKPESK